MRGGGREDELDTPSTRRLLQLFWDQTSKNKLSTRKKKKVQGYRLWKHHHQQRKRGGLREDGGLEAESGCAWAFVRFTSTGWYCLWIWLHLHQTNMQKLCETTIPACYTCESMHCTIKAYGVTYPINHTTHTLATMHFSLSSHLAVFCPIRLRQYSNTSYLILTAVALNLSVRPTVSLIHTPSFPLSLSSLARASTQEWEVLLGDRLAPFFQEAERRTWFSGCKNKHQWKERVLRKRTSSLHLCY